jgi:enoyl-CoA hydratase/carnithine racemase
LPIAAEEGCAWGLVDQTVESTEELPAATRAFCGSFKRGGPVAVSLAKRATRDGDDLSAFEDCFKSPDRAEGIAAFLEKRSASWME